MDELTTLELLRDAFGSSAKLASHLRNEKRKGPPVRVSHLGPRVEKWVCDARNTEFGGCDAIGKAYGPLLERICAVCQCEWIAIAFRATEYGMFPFRRFGGHKKASPLMQSLGERRSTRRDRDFTLLSDLVLKDEGLVQITLEWRFAPGPPSLEARKRDARLHLTIRGALRRDGEPLHYPRDREATAAWFLQLPIVEPATSARTEALLHELWSRSGCSPRAIARLVVLYMLHAADPANAERSGAFRVDWYLSAAVGNHEVSGGLVIVRSNRWRALGLAPGGMEPVSTDTLMQAIRAVLVSPLESLVSEHTARQRAAVAAMHQIPKDIGAFTHSWGEFGDKYRDFLDKHPDVRAEAPEFRTPDSLAVAYMHALALSEGVLHELPRDLAARLAGEWTNQMLQEFVSRVVWPAVWERTLSESVTLEAWLARHPAVGTSPDLLKRSLPVTVRLGTQSELRVAERVSTMGLYPLLLLALRHLYWRLILQMSTPGGTAEPVVVTVCIGSDRKGQYIDISCPVVDKGSVGLPAVDPFVGLTGQWGFDASGSSGLRMRIRRTERDREGDGEEAAQTAAFWQ